MQSPSDPEALEFLVSTTASVITCLVVVVFAIMAATEAYVAKDFLMFWSTLLTWGAALFAGTAIRHITQLKKTASTQRRTYHLASAVTKTVMSLLYVVHAISLGAIARGAIDDGFLHHGKFGFNATSSDPFPLQVTSLLRAAIPIHVYITVLSAFSVAGAGVFVFLHSFSMERSSP